VFSTELYDFTLVRHSSGGPHSLGVFTQCLQGTPSSEICPRQTLLDSVSYSLRGASEQRLRSPVSECFATIADKMRTPVQQRESDARPCLSPL
jgi:hypothetical protein